jgi:signal transduction histidine kinase
VIEPMSDILERMEAFDPIRFGSSTYDAGGLRSETFDAEPLDAETFEPQTFEPEPLDAEAFEPEAFEQKAFEPEAFEPETMLEPEPFGTEPFDAATIAAADRTADDAGLVSRVSAATFQVSQAMEGLEQVAGLLRAAEELAKDSDGQRRGAEEALGLVESQRKELGEMLTRVRSEAAEAGQRVAAAEERANTAEERANTAEERLQQALERTFALEARLDDGTGEEPVAETARQLTVIVDDRREELREAVATEIRRPLTSIMGLTLAMKHADPTSSSGKTMIRQLGASARRLERLVVQLTELDGIANGSYVPNRRRVDLKAIVRRVVEETPDIAELDVRVHAEHAAVETDPALTEQMVEILLANAGRRSSPGNPVWVQVASDQAGAIVAVDDMCPEIPAGIQMQGSEDEDGARQKRPRGATGLALLSRLAELHGGRAWVEARSGGGASFRVFLPSASQEPHADTPDPSATATELAGDHENVVVDATAVRSPSLPERLRELSSFDDLSDELAQELAIEQREASQINRAS